MLKRTVLEVCLDIVVSRAQNRVRTVLDRLSGLSIAASGIRSPGVNELHHHHHQPHPQISQIRTASQYKTTHSEDDAFPIARKIQDHRLTRARPRTTCNRPKSIGMKRRSARLASGSGGRTTS